MKIYTKTGDDGTTALYGGKRVSKADIQVEAYGSLDELSSALGMFAVHLNQMETDFIEDIQRDIYSIMGALAGAPIELNKLQTKVALFEKKIDSISQTLPPLKDFIIPGGSAPAAWAHIARVSCRKAERVNVLAQSSPLIIQYLNRLSDLLFIYARMLKKDSLSKRDK